MRSYEVADLVTQSRLAGILAAGGPAQVTWRIEDKSAARYVDSPTSIWTGSLDSGVVEMTLEVDGGDMQFGFIYADDPRAVEWTDVLREG